MPGYLKQSTAAQSRAIGPFVDDTDFKTLETGLTIANTDIKLVVNGGASANKNSGGGTHRVNGVYGITFDATDTATVGEMEVSVSVAGALVVFDKFFVVEEAVYDMLFGASAIGYIVDQPVNATKLGGTTQTGRDIGASVLLSNGTGAGQLKLASGYVAMTWADIAAPTTVVDFTGTTIATTQKVDVNTIKTNPVVNGGTVTFPTNATLASTTNITAGTITTVTTVTNQLTAAAIATGVWQDATAGDFTVASSIGKALFISNIVPGAAGGHMISGSNAGTTTFGAFTVTGATTFTGAVVGTSGSNDLRINGIVPGVTNGLFIAGTNAATVVTTSLTTTFTGNLTGSVGSVTGAVGSVTAGVTLAAAAVQAIWDALTAALTTAGSIGKLLADNINATISSRATPVQVNTEVVDALAVDTYAEPGQAAPGATVTLATKIGYLYKAWRNRTTQTATDYNLYADNATTVDQKATFSDDATTADRSEIASGP